MSDLVYILASLRARALSNTLSALLVAFGVMLAMVMMLFTAHVEKRLTADGQGIDLVVGAKGSPLQLILSSVYHIDIPTGNIPWDQAQKIIKHPQVAEAIPLALGDNYRGFRIVGTSQEYINHYQGQLADGHFYDEPFEVVTGADVATSQNLMLGTHFHGAHGLSESGHVHEDESYRVVGILKPSGTVLDRLILTPLDSVLLIHGLEETGHDHGHHEEHTHHHDHEEHDHHDHHTHKEAHNHGHAGAPEITALLLKVKSPQAVMNLPRTINRTTNFQAANPAFEMARLSGMLGIGTEALTYLSGFLILMAVLSIFTGLTNALETRRADMAVLRAIGYGKCRIFTLIAGEGLMLTTTGLIIGVLAGYGVFSVVSQTLAPLSASGASASLWTPEILWLAAAVLLAGLLAALRPAWHSTRLDVARELSI